MSHWEGPGKSSDWFTPKYIFDALGLVFDLDVAAPKSGAPNVPCKAWLWAESLSLPWYEKDFIWMNPPFGGRNAIEPWLDKFVEHGNGIALTPDRTSAPWFQSAARRADAILFVSPKIRFEKPDGTRGASPSTGTALMGIGWTAREALRLAAPELGLFVQIGEARCQARK